MTNYELVRDVMKTGDCLLFSSYSPIASGIKMFTNSPWSHASLVIRLSEFEGEERHRYYVEATHPCVKLTRLTAKMEEYTGVIAWLPLSADYDDFRTLFGHTMLELIDRKYDYKSVLKQMFSKVSTDASSFFCSELCGYVWSMGILGFSDIALQPCDIPKLSIFDGVKPYTIYDGRV